MNIDTFVKDHGLFDVVVVDPPWMVTNRALVPSRGVRLSFKEMIDADLLDLCFEKFSKNGLLFLWCVNNKLTLAFKLLKSWGYRYVYF
jgi:N6-adenosine-specific RNA methylase IME4